MLHLDQLDRSYSPETIAVMSGAFDKVYQFISNGMNDSDDGKMTLALTILRLVDEGERDPERLAETAFREWTGADLLRRRFRNDRTLAKFDDAIEELEAVASANWSRLLWLTTDSDVSGPEAI